MEAGLNEATLAAFIGLVRLHTGIAMNERKSVLLERRLRPRMQALALDSYQAYLDKVQRDRSELPHFIDLVTTNDTLFFRTPPVWDYVEQEFLPQWLREHAGQTLRIWSAAAASGEEMYSIAMLCEEFAAAHPGFRYHILATDISQQILDQAAQGDYGGRSVERLQSAYPQLAKKYFQASAKGLKASETLKKHVELARHNLLHRLRQPRQFDLVFLRNVMIYFDPEHQQIVLDQASHSMAPHARLVIGEQETIAAMDTCFRPLRPMIYTIEKSTAS
ncbi:CheR family methyltransferase [Oxalobacteraceae bacterium A2-2]